MSDTKLDPETIRAIEGIAAEFHRIIESRDTAIRAERNQNTMLKLRLVDLLEDAKRSDVSQFRQSAKLAKQLLESMGVTVRDNPPPRVVRRKTPETPQ